MLAWTIVGGCNIWNSATATSEDHPLDDAKASSIAATSPTPSVVPNSNEECYIPEFTISEIMQGHACLCSSCTPDYKKRIDEEILQASRSRLQTLAFFIFKQTNFNGMECQDNVC